MEAKKEVKESFTVATLIILNLSGLCLSYILVIIT